MYSFLSIKHLIFFSDIAILPFATIKSPGLYPKTKLIQHHPVKQLDETKIAYNLYLGRCQYFFKCYATQKPEYIAFNSVQITIECLALY